VTIGLAPTLTGSFCFSQDHMVGGRRHCLLPPKRSNSSEEVKRVGAEEEGRPPSPALPPSLRDRGRGEAPIPGPSPVPAGQGKGAGPHPQPFPRPCGTGEGGRPPSPTLPPSLRDRGRGEAPIPGPSPAPAGQGKGAGPHPQPFPRPYGTRGPFSLCCRGLRTGWGWGVCLSLRRAGRLGFSVWPGQALEWLSPG
jgi:hypothetical protein